MSGNDSYLVVPENQEQRALSPSSVRLFDLKNTDFILRMSDCPCPTLRLFWIEGK